MYGKVYLAALSISNCFRKSLTPLWKFGGLTPEQAGNGNIDLSGSSIGSFLREQGGFCRKALKSGCVGPYFLSCGRPISILPTTRGSDISEEGDSHTYTHCQSAQL